MTDPQGVELSLLGAIEMFKAKPAKEWTAEELAAFRLRLEQSPSLATALGGRDKVDRKLEEVAAALGQARVAGGKPQDSAELSQASNTGTTAAAPRSRKTRHLVEAGIFLLLLGGAGVWLLSVIANRGEKPAMNQENKPVADVKQPADTAAADQKQLATAESAAGKKHLIGKEHAAAEEPVDSPPPALVKNDDHTWQDWTVTTENGAQWTVKDDWDLTDPSNPRPTKLLTAEGGRLTLSRRLKIDDAGHWLEINARPLPGGTKPGSIAVRLGNSAIAETTIGGGGTKWPLYVSLEKYLGREVTLDVVYEAGKAVTSATMPKTATAKPEQQKPKQQKIVIWNLALVGDKRYEPRSESGLVEALSSKNPKERLYAIKNAGFGGEVEIPAIVAALSDSELTVRLSAVAALCRFKEPTAREALRTTLAADGDRMIRTQIATHFAKHPEPGDVDSLMKALQAPKKAPNGKSSRLHAEVMRALGQLGGGDVDAKMIAALEHSSPELRHQAAATLAKSKSKEADAAMLKALTDSKDLEVRQQAAYHFELYPSRAAIGPLTAALKGNSGLVSDQAALALGAMNNAEATAVLIQAMTAGDANVREAAATGLAQQNSPAAAAALLTVLTSGTDPRVREQAALHFQKHPDPQAVAPLVQRLQARGVERADEEERLQIIKTLGFIGGGDALAALRPLTQDPNRNVRQAANQALRRSKGDKQMVNMKPGQGI